MDDKYCQELCNERHEKIDDLIEALSKKHDDLKICLDKKFSSLFFLVATIFGGLIINLLVLLLRSG